jgi:twitching motility protein PilU
MDISPYVKLMIEKRADCLMFNAGQAPRVILDSQERNVGQQLIGEEAIQAIFEAITTDTQKLQLSINKKVRFITALFGGVNLIAEITETDSENNLSIVISQDKRGQVEKTTIPDNIRVLGETPEQQLDLIPYLSKVVELGGSDLFTTSGSVVKAKVHGSAIGIRHHD